MIKYKEIKDFGIKEFSNELKSLLRESDLFCLNEYQIVYNCLTKINFKNLNNNNSSIEKYCLKVLKALTQFKSFYEEPINSFLLLVLNLKTLPIKHKIELEKTTKNDLLKIEELINHYESKEFIKQHNIRGGLPRNHEDNTVLVFYKRTLKKRKEILDYLLYKLESRAIEKSKPQENYKLKGLDLTEFDSKFAIHYDYPYKDFIYNENGWYYEIDFEKLDYRKINPLRNKTFSLKINSDFSNGYTEQLKKEIEKHFNSNTYLRYIINKIKTIPIINKREAIFLELNELYLQKKWYGFYALALPQIEGIFSEMTLILNPNIKQSGSLSDKVQKIRPYHDNSDYYFDYYEFYLPNQRNKFSHSGKDELIEVKCYFLLLDLVNILNIVEELNSPLMETNKIFQKGAHYFEDIGKFSRFLFLLNEVELKRQTNLLNNDPNVFVKDELLNKINIKFFLSNLQKDFEIACKNFGEHFLMISQWQKAKGIAIFSLTNQQIVAQIGEIQKIINVGLNVLFEEDLKLLIDTNYFITKFQTQFASLDQEILQEFIDFRNNNKDELEKIQILNAKLKIELPDDFTISKRKWNHILQK